MEENRIMYQSHKPLLQSGDYKLKVTQKVTVGSEVWEKHQDVEFSIAGEQYHLNPEHIGAHYPPVKGIAEYENILPHISLTRSTLPWERSAVKGKAAAPWLALIVVHEKEYSAIRNETAPGEESLIQLLELERSFPLPQPALLNMLSHVNSDETHAEDTAIIIANRFPDEGHNTAYLVSLEGRFDDKDTFNYNDHAAPNSPGKFSVVVLYSWSFTCNALYRVSQHGIDQLQGLNENNRKKLEKLKGRLFHTAEALTKNAALDNYPHMDCSVFHCRSFEDQVKHLDKHPLQLPPPPATDKSLTDAWKNNAYIKNGFCILPHKAINGAKSISWYRGPVSKNRVPISKAENHHASDNWVQKQNHEADVVDVSYSAAWELGRLLALENTGFASELYHWKRKHVQYQHFCKQKDLHKHLVDAHELGAPDVPDAVFNWLKEIPLLKGIPFHYLIADERLLPIDSIRFFQINWQWIWAFIDGAFSLVRSPQQVEKDELMHQAITKLGLTYDRKTGILIRSSLIAEYPALTIRINEEVFGKLEKLSDNVLICFFDGDIKKADLQIHARQHHFECRNDNEVIISNEDYSIKLKDSTGHKTSVDLASALWYVPSVCRFEV